MAKKKVDYVKLKNWAEEFQPAYLEKISEIEAGNAVVTISGVQMNAKQFIKNCLHAQSLMEDGKLNSTHKEKEAVRLAKEKEEADKKAKIAEQEKKRREGFEKKEVERRKVREERRKKREAELAPQTSDKPKEEDIEL